MGAHVGLLPDRTPLWRLFPLPGTTTRRLSPQEAPLRPTLSPWWCGGLPLGQQPEHGQLELRAEGRKEDEPGLAEAHGLNSTT